MNYFMLNSIGNEWVLVNLNNVDMFLNNKAYLKIKLYDDKLKFVGIGLY